MCNDVAIFLASPKICFQMVVQLGQIRALLYKHSNTLDIYQIHLKVRRPLQPTKTNGCVLGVMDMSPRAFPGTKAFR